ncbi:hypothetical protein Tco_0651755 [Tanacetum coccineum]|uniref:Uncharacterized protein n=1 Tax=Tanacetum coccineum TaxID=301880 RepID=A0ABQ4WWB5_9ASTR
MIDMRYDVSDIGDNNVRPSMHMQEAYNQEEIVYSTKRILAVTHVSVMRKHRYGYLDEIVVRRFDNILYRFKEEYRHGVLAKEKMEQFGKEKSSFHDQRHQQATEGKKDDDDLWRIHLVVEHYGTDLRLL